MHAVSLQPSYEEKSLDCVLWMDLWDMTIMFTEIIKQDQDLIVLFWFSEKEKEKKETDLK